MPVSPSKVTWSPMRSGWVTASSSPATALPSVVRDAKPTIAAKIAPEARNGAIRRLSEANCARAMPTPIKTIVTSTTRRRKRRRVSISGVSVPPARRVATVWALRASARSTTRTSAKVTASAIAAVIHWSLSVHQDATRCGVPWTGMERDRSGALVWRPAARLPVLRLEAGAALALRAAWMSRLAVWAAGVGALALWGTSGREAGFDASGVTAPFGHVGDLLAGPAARWDSAWYLGIAEHGYGPKGTPALFPLYPLLVRAGSWVVGSPRLAGALISVACLVAGLAAVHELARLELGADAARWTVIALAWSPMSF